jgi:transglutaminase-like putative cysteine protease
VTGKANSIWTIAVLVVLGIGFFILRLNLNFEAGDSDFRLTYDIKFHTRQPDGRGSLPNARLLAAYPETTRFCQVSEPQKDHPGMAEAPTRVHTATSRKDIVLHSTKAGELSCKLSFRIHLDRNGDWHGPPELPLKPEERTAYLANAKGMTATSTTAREIVNRLRDDHPHPQELVDRIFQESIRTIEPSGDTLLQDTGDEALLHQRGSPLGRAMAFATLCRAAKFPARLVTGFEIKKPENKKQETVQPRRWVEVYVADPQKPTVERWIPYDPENGFLHALDYNIVPARRDGIDLIRVTNATDLQTDYSIESIPPLTRTPLAILDLRHLPGKLKEPIKVVLILPIGALFTALFRTIIGIRTFGTFSPTLLALAFVYNDWRSGLCIFFVVLATGFISRTLLDRLKLLLVPRLGIILTMVVMLMVLGISVMNYYDWAPDGRTVLLPMVILTNLVERFYVTTEEDSIFEAVRLLLASVLLALAIYLLLCSPGLGNILFDYPEMHFFTVAALILIGRYTGYRLMELIRFRDLVPPDVSNPPGTGDKV